MDVELDETFDFGFSAVKETDIKVPEAEDKLLKMYNMIIPLLDNLEKDSDTMPYIHWPDRSVKIKEFKKKLKALLEKE